MAGPFFCVRVCLIVLLLLAKSSLFSLCPRCSGPFDPEHFNQFKGIPFAEDRGLVLRTFKIEVPGAPYAHNPSILKSKQGYTMAFRYDPSSNKLGNPKTFIGYVELDKKFEAIAPFRLIDTGNHNSEDPRLFATEDQTFLSCTHLITFTPQVCNIAVSQIDLENQITYASSDLNYNKGSREKNWTPFVYRTPQGRDEVYFVYKYFPHRILKVDMPFSGNVRIAYNNTQGQYTLEAWEKKWGLIRGGTPAIRVGNEYMAFFHSSFISGKLLFYIFGAITFEGKPPFRVTKISKEPILFRGMYETPVTEDVWIYPRNRVRVIFPSGVVDGREQGRDVLYVVCGENDVAIKCVVLDKEALFDSLQAVY